ncbi:DUF438 domain-containing protein [Globicatella sp. PHS-GS-PNBC-21-1553]|uniref:DUF438 domain-containing protein n=1 Tax=Globicatella sp. PHS-GS-PNBC-21-1553 TaxID=2885764 RepID=UPI00298EE646|nr:DUF438 domain-containing protein [Globicatella sp. PHS-GS-PNBC-21-1553]WPC08902.1 DUF438 domain-containing protein [Globicatella sp. PHS-GS-PNBC-21-1553]
MTKRIEILKDILLKLHHGASPESVQALFNEHFTGVSAIEISLMEHELMNGDHGIGFEDVMKLCNVHANLFKEAIHEVAISDTDQPGHPVHTFKLENVALRAALIRVKRLLTAIKENDTAVEDGLLQGLDRQFQLLGQFKRHYDRKEAVIFPIMERYGHEAPPKVMWGVDDEIRELFDRAYQSFQHYPTVPIETTIEQFDIFETEFLEMIFKEESILLLILLETFSQDDWLQVEAESDDYGYAIIKPEAKWQPERVDFQNQDMAKDENTTDNDIQKDAPIEASKPEYNQAPHKQSEAANSEQNEGAAPSQNEAATPSYNKVDSPSQNETTTRTIETEDGTFTITFEPKQQSKDTISRDRLLPFGNGHLSLEQANLILNHLPIELTFVNKEDIFQYYNDHVPFEEMLFKRNPGQIGRHVELCHPPKLIERVKQVFEVLRSGQQDEVKMWFKRDDQFIHITYMAVRNSQGAFEGVLELVQDIQPYFDLETDMWRGIEPPKPKA